MYFNNPTTTSLNQTRSIAVKYKILVMRYTGQHSCLRSPYPYGQANRVHCFAVKAKHTRVTAIYI